MEVSRKDVLLIHILNVLTSETIKELKQTDLYSQKQKNLINQLDKITLPKYKNYYKILSEEEQREQFSLFELIPRFTNILNLVSDEKDFKFVAEKIKQLEKEIIELNGKSK